MYRILILFLLFLIYLAYFRNKRHYFYDTPELKYRIVDSKVKPNFKLKAYCINLKNKIENFNFIKNEWKDYLNIERYIALDTCTNSHKDLLKNIYKNRNNLNFPIAIIEDDVFKKNNFVEYWNEIPLVKNCDYVTFDAIFLKQNKEKKFHPMFVSLKQHRNTGFIVYYSSFFNKLKSIEDIDKLLEEPLDMTFTYNTFFNKCTPNRQVCRQVVSKKSSTNKNNSKTNHYNNYYKKAEEYLKKL